MQPLTRCCNSAVEKSGRRTVASSVKVKINKKLLATNFVSSVASVISHSYCFKSALGKAGLKTEISNIYHCY
jgi:hypothetical protein